jgi:uncharacterized membrane protein YvbJ
MGTGNLDSDQKIEIKKLIFSDDKIFKLDDVKRNVFINFLKEKMKLEKNKFTRSMMSILFLFF